MPSKPLILGFDTSAAYCAAALLSGGNVIAKTSEDMKRGQAERLMPLLQGLLEKSGYVWQDLDAIGVGTGPGNFTGIRISVSAARGLALGLNIPAVGVTSFEAISHNQPSPHIPVVSAPRDQIYAILPGMDAAQMDRSILDHQSEPIIFSPIPADFAVNIADIARSRYASAPPPPAPYYLRTADAAPPRDKAPTILENPPQL